MTARLPWNLRWRLSVLWILEWGITGTILTYLPLYLTEIGLSSERQGLLMAVGAVGLWVAPFFVGQVADRWLASEKYLAISHLIGALTLAALPFATELYRETGENFSALVILIGLYAVAYFPTMAVATSLTFRHLPDPDAQFGKVRVWGTVGWMLAGFSLSVWLGRREAIDWAYANFPNWRTAINNVNEFVTWLPRPSSADCFRIAAILSFVLSSFCIFLPATPPARTRESGIAPLQILGMFRDRQFSTLIGISFMLSLVVPLYTLHVPKLLQQSGVGSDWIPAVMLIGQISEFPALWLLPMFLKRLGLKTTFAVGMAAWLVRYLFFAAGEPMWLLLTGLGLHGICHVFLIIVIQLYVDSECPRDLRATAQNLFAFITMGIGMPLGLWLGGLLGQFYFDEKTNETDYQLFFTVPAVVIATILVVFWRSFDAAGSSTSGQGGPAEVG